MQNKKLLLFIVLPSCLNIALIGLYFSGYTFAQQIAAPSVHGLPFRSWREFGLVEQLQNVFLLTIVVMFVINCARDDIAEKAMFLVGTLVILFLLLEEIDYGIHFYEYYVGHAADIANESRNWHNKNMAGKTNVAYLKKIVDLTMVFWFVLMPIVSQKFNFAWLQKLIPSLWFLAGFAISLLFASLAHYLQDLSLDVIDGVKGNLAGNISEFRETTNYYLYLLYALQLVKTSNIFSSRLTQNA
jgi:hypothetical protein